MRKCTLCVVVRTPEASFLNVTNWIFSFLFISFGLTEDLFDVWGGLFIFNYLQDLGFYNPSTQFVSGRRQTLSNSVYFISVCAIRWRFYKLRGLSILTLCTSSYSPTSNSDILDLVDMDAFWFAGHSVKFTGLARGLTPGRNRTWANPFYDLEHLFVSSHLIFRLTPSGDTFSKLFCLSHIPCSSMNGHHQLSFHTEVNWLFRWWQYWNNIERQYCLNFPFPTAW